MPWHTNAVCLASGLPKMSWDRMFSELMGHRGGRSNLGTGRLYCGGGLVPGRVLGRGWCRAEVCELQTSEARPAA